MTKRWKLVLLASAALVAAVAAKAIVGLWPTGPDPERLALGHELFATHCAACHGAELQGQPNWQTPMPDGTMPAPPLNGSGHARHHRRGELVRIVKDGMATVNGGQPTAMPAFGEVLSENEIAALLDYVETTW